MKYLVVALMLTGCGATSDYKRASEVEADMPRAMGLGTFAPSCIMFCTVTTDFTHGDDTLIPDKGGIITGTSSVERHQKTLQMKKPKPPKQPPPGETP